MARNNAPNLCLWQLVLVLVCALPLAATAQQARPFAPNRFDYLFAGHQFRIAASAEYGGNSVDLLALTSAVRIIDEFVASDILLIGGLIPGDQAVAFGSRVRAGAFGGFAAGAWRMNLHAEAASYATVQLPLTVATLLRAGNVVPAAMDTRDMAARGLLTREFGVTAGRRTRAGDISLDLGVSARHIAPVLFVGGRIDPLYDGPALVIHGDTISAQADIVHQEGRVDGGGLAFDFAIGIIFRNLNIAVTVSDVGRVRVDTRAHHRAVDVRSLSLLLFAEHIDNTRDTIVSESHSLSLPPRIDARVSAALASTLSIGLFYRNQIAAIMGTGSSAFGLNLGWHSGSVLDARVGVARFDANRWTVLAGAGLELGRMFIDVDVDADGLQLDRARGINAAASFGIHF